MKKDSSQSMFRMKKLGDKCTAYQPKHVHQDLSNEAEMSLRESVYEHFKATSGNEDLAVGEEGKILFIFTCDTAESRTKRGGKLTKRKIYFGVPDKTLFADVLEKMTTLVEADTSTSVFMTNDNFGIRNKQTAGSVFMKYGNELTFMTGIHLSKVAFGR